MRIQGGAGYNLPENNWATWLMADDANFSLADGGEAAIGVVNPGAHATPAIA
jgi:hypothetical protein